MKVAVRYGDKVAVPRDQARAAAWSATRRCTRKSVLVPDVSKDPRYIKLVDGRAIGAGRFRCCCKDRCIGVFDLESPELDAFKKSDVEILTLLASQAAVAIENARLYETIRANEVRLEKELRFAQRVQAALLPTELPKRLKGVDVAARFAPARELGGDLYDFLAPEPNSLVVAVGDVSGKGVPAALYSAFAGELVRSRTFRRRYAPERFEPGRRAGVDEHDPLRAAARGVLLHALLRGVRLQAPHRRRSPTPGCRIRFAAAATDGRSTDAGRADRAAGRAARIVSRVDLRRGHASISAPGDLFVFCTDGVFEANDALRREFGARAAASRSIEAARDGTAREIVDAIFDAVQEFRGDALPNDDMTAVAITLDRRDLTDRRSESPRSSAILTASTYEALLRAGAGRRLAAEDRRRRRPGPSRARARRASASASSATAPSLRRCRRPPCRA